MYSLTFRSLCSKHDNHEIITAVFCVHIKSTPNITANERHAWLDECAVHATQKNLKLSSDGGDCGSNKCKQGYGCAYGGVWRSLRLVEVWSQAVGFVLVRLAATWLQSPWRCFHISSTLQRNFINFVFRVQFTKMMLQQIILQLNTKKKKGFIPIKFDGSYVIASININTTANIHYRHILSCNYWVCYIVISFFIHLQGTWSSCFHVCLREVFVFHHMKFLSSWNTRAITSFHLTLKWRGIDWRDTSNWLQGLCQILNSLNEGWC
jgi:hypothetical protein